MEKQCKPSIEEKHYSYPRVLDTSSKNDPKSEVRQVDCGKNGGFFSKGGKDSPPPPPPPLVMPPPPYSDLGKQANDVFNKGYHFGKLQLSSKTKTGTGVEFNTGGYSDQEKGKVFGSLDTKYTIKDYGITFTERWNTDNTLGTEVTVKDQCIVGLQLTTNFTFSPESGNKGANVKTAFNNDRVAVNTDVAFGQDPGPIVLGSAVVGYQGWLAGYQAGFDTQNSKLTKSNFALGFSTGDFILHTCVEDGQQFGGSIYQKVSPKLDSGVQLQWSAGSNETKFGIGCRYELDSDASIRAKINNASQLGFGYQQRLREGVTVTLSALIDGKNFNEGGHKVGFALDLEA